jgi:hypothetical protein
MDSGCFTHGQCVRNTTKRGEGNEMNKTVRSELGWVDLGISVVVVLAITGLLFLGIIGIVLGTVVLQLLS